MKNIATPNAPAAIGPYSQAIKAGNLVFCSGQLGIDPATGELADSVVSQAQQVFKNLAAVLAEARLSLGHVTKTTVFLADLNDFTAVNTIYAKAFGDHKPARATVEVARLPLDARVEVECIAVTGD